jgi:FtsP/CotA-like multicopper oxidase with cupredoxin domain
MHRLPRLRLATPLLAAAALAALSTVQGAIVATATEPTTLVTPDRASLEELLRERTVTPTGQVRRFDLEVRTTEWELLPGVATEAVTFNGTVPGPTIRVSEGDSVEVVVTNSLDEPTAVHWHGIHVPNAMDGVAGVTQPAIEPGESFTYSFVAPHAGTFMYHAHGPNSREQMDRGLYAPFIIDPAGGDPVAWDAEATLTIGNWMIEGDGGHEGMSGMEPAGAQDPMSMEYTYFTINGKAFPATEGLTVAQGDLVRLRFLNPSQTVHPMHLHGMDMAIFAKDGEPLTEAQRLNTLDISQGETYDVAFIADNPGVWLLHCHDLHHASNNGVEPGGLIMTITVLAPGETAPATTPEPAGSPAQDMGAMDGMSPMPGMDH